MGYPIINAVVKIEDGRWSSIRSKNPVAFKTLATQLMQELKEKAKPTLLEPFMHVEITLPDSEIGDILSDISSQRGGHILGIKTVNQKFLQDNIDEKRQCIVALIPLSEMVGYTTYLRSLTKG